MEPTPFRPDRHAATPLTFRVCFTGDVATIVVSGELDHATAPDLADALDAIRTAGVDRIVVDAADVAFIDGRGLAVLQRCAAATTAIGGWLRVVHPSRSVERLLELTEQRGLLAVRADERSHGH